MSETSEDIAKMFISHLLNQQREAFVEISILRHLLYKTDPNMPNGVWDTIINNMMVNPATTKKIRDPFDAESAKVLKAFDDQITMLRTKKQIANLDAEIKQMINRMVELKSKFPDKLLN